MTIRTNCYAFVALQKRSVSLSKDISGRSRAQVRRNGFCPECKERLESCVCEEREPLNFDEEK